MKIKLIFILFIGALCITNCTSKKNTEVVKEEVIEQNESQKRLSLGTILVKLEVLDNNEETLPTNHLKASVKEVLGLGEAAEPIENGSVITLKYREIESLVSLKDIKAGTTINVVISKPISAITNSTNNFVWNVVKLED